jgi:hypothetical protein
MILIKLLSDFASDFQFKKLDNKLIVAVLKFGFTCRVGKSKRSLAANVLRLGEGGDFYHKC